MMRRLTSAPKPGGPGGGVHRRGVGRVDSQAVAHPVVAGEVGGGLPRRDEVVGREPEGDLGHRDLLDPRAGRGERVGRLAHPGRDIGIGRVEELGEHADPESVDPVLDAREDRRDRLVERRRVAGIVAADHVEEQRGVGDRGRERADLVERAGEGDQAVAGDRSVGRLHPDHAAERGRLADRAAGVGAERERHETGRHRRGRAARGAARDPPGVVGVVGRPEGRGLGRGAHGELVHVGLAD